MYIGNREQATPSAYKLSDNVRFFLQIGTLVYLDSDSFVNGIWGKLCKTIGIYDENEV